MSESPSSAEGEPPPFNARTWTGQARDGERPRGQDFKKLDYSARQDGEPWVRHGGEPSTYWLRVSPRRPLPI